VLQPLLDEPSAIEPYEQGSWGPKSSDRLARGVGGWHDPWLDKSAPGLVATTGPNAATNRDRLEITK